MGNTTLTHKLRNPKDLSKWLDIWTADVANTNNYTITPSEHWEIPANQITDYTYTPEPTQDNPNPDPVTEKNTTIENPEGNHIAITNNNGSISEGPEIDQNSNIGTDKSFLNERGQWVPINLFINPIYSQNIETGSAPSGYSVYNPYGTENVLSVKFGDSDIWSWLGQYYIGSAENTLNFWTLNDSWDQRHGHRIIVDVDQIDSKHIKDNAVTTSKIADEAITAPKIADEAITINKIAQSAINAIDTWQPNLKDQNGYVVQPPELEEDAKPMIWAAAPDQDPKWMTIVEAAGISTTDVTSDSFLQYVDGTALIITGAPIISVTAEVDSITGDIAHVEPIKFEQAVSGTALTLVEKPIIRIEVIRTKETNNEESSG